MRAKASYETPQNPKKERERKVKNPYANGDGSTKSATRRGRAASSSSSGGASSISSLISAPITIAKKPKNTAHTHKKKRRSNPSPRYRRLRAPRVDGVVVEQGRGGGGARHAAYISEARKKKKRRKRLECGVGE